MDTWKSNWDHPIPNESVELSQSSQSYRGQSISKWEAITQIASAIQSALLAGWRTMNNCRRHLPHHARRAQRFTLPKLVAEDSETVSKYWTARRERGFRGKLWWETGLNNCIPEGHHLSPSGGNLTSPFMPGRSKRKSHPITLQRILSTPLHGSKLHADLKHALWSLQSAGSLPHSPNPSGRTSFWNSVTLTLLLRTFLHPCWWQDYHLHWRLWSLRR